MAIQKPRGVGGITTDTHRSWPQEPNTERQWDVHGQTRKGDRTLDTMVARSHTEAVAKVASKRGEGWDWIKATAGMTTIRNTAGRWVTMRGRRVFIGR